MKSADDPQPPRRGGRPRTVDSQGRPVGKAAALSTRMTEETRAALTSAAAARGVSLSHLAEVWLSDAARSRVGVSDDIQDALNDLGAFAAEVSALGIGDPARDSLARETLLAGWQIIMRHALPSVPLHPEAARLQALLSQAPRASDAVVMALADYGSPGDPVIAAVTEPGPPEGLGGLLTQFGQDGSGDAGPPILQRLGEISRGGFVPLGLGFPARLEAAAEKGDTGRAELLALAALLREIHEARRADREVTEAARAKADQLLAAKFPLSAIDAAMRGAPGLSLGSAPRRRLS